MTTQTWLVTGATSGLGRAIAEAALDAGHHVVAVGRSPERLAELEARGATPLALDVTAPDAAHQVAEAIGETGVDVLVNAAGRAQIGAVEETTDDQLRALMELHFFAPAALVRAVLPTMRAQGSGTIVQLSSMGGRMSFAGAGAYSATKAALEGLSQGLVEEVRGHGIRVLVVEPGAFRTGLHGGALELADPLPGYDESVGPTRRQMESYDGTQPGDPAKAAAAVLAALRADEPPFRLVLGGDAVDALRGELEAGLSELEAWEDTSRGTDLEE
jgi:NAD(P)-dependent dehydrogenase (short-subunit alcohol dehydrogenase family)